MDALAAAAGAAAFGVDGGVGGGEGLGDSAGLALGTGLSGLGGTGLLGGCFGGGLTLLCLSFCPSRQ